MFEGRENAVWFVWRERGLSDLSGWRRCCLVLWTLDISTSNNRVHDTKRTQHLDTTMPTTQCHCARALQALSRC